MLLIIQIRLLDVSNLGVRFYLTFVPFHIIVVFIQVSREKDGLQGLLFLRSFLGVYPQP